MKVASVSISLFPSSSLYLLRMLADFDFLCLCKNEVQKSKITAVTPCKKVAGVILETVATNETLFHNKVKGQTDDMLADLEAADLSLDKHV